MKHKMNKWLIITTSREPSRRTRSFIKDLVLAVPHSIKFNRGKFTLDDLRRIVINKGAYGLLMIYEKKANPSALVYYEISGTELKRTYLLKITSIKLGREIREYQKPLGIKSLVIGTPNIGEGLPTHAVEALVKIFKPSLYQNRPPQRSIEVVVVGDSSGLLVSFICTSSERPCGPTFKITGVKRYE